MSIIGIDLGTHVCSIALWSESADSTLVLADDMGSRTIPSIVAYRNEEIIIGQAALSQQSKNPSNTFDSVLKSLMYEPADGKLALHVPVLEKEISVVEMASHIFRNIHNQVKQQVGTAVRESVVVVNKPLDEAATARLLESAKLGGIRIKSILSNTVGALLAYRLDETSVASVVPAPPVQVAAAPAAKGGKSENNTPVPTLAPPTHVVTSAIAINPQVSTVLVVDIGYSQTTGGIYTIEQGIYKELINKQSTVCTAAILVNLLVQHCVKDFQKKTKLNCTESTRCMLRLQRECEQLIKMLSTSNEANMTVDALYESMDYSFKITRAKFEDICAMPFMQLRNFITAEVLSNSDYNGAITHVLIIGGLSAVPKIHSLIKTCLSALPQVESIQYPKLLNIDSSEVCCLGAAFHGTMLYKQGLLDTAFALNIPAAIPTTTRNIYLSSVPLETVFHQLAIQGEGSETSPVCIVTKGTVLPYNNTISTISDSNNPSDSVYFELLSTKDDKYVSLGFVNIPLTTVIAGIINIQVKIAVNGAMEVIVTNTKSQVITTVAIPVV